MRGFFKYELQRDDEFATVKRGIIIKSRGAELNSFDSMDLFCRLSPVSAE